MPAVAESVNDLVIAGAPLTVKVSVRFPVPAAFVAPSVTVDVPVNVGVPEIIPVLVFTDSTHAVDTIGSAGIDGRELATRLVLLIPDGPRRLTETEQAGFVSAYDVGIQSISEILITQGLW